MALRHFLQNITARNSRVSQYFLLQKPPDIHIIFSARSLHLFTGRWAKIFVDTENEHAHQVLQQSDKSYQIFLKKMPPTMLITPTRSEFLSPSASSLSDINEMFQQYMAICQECRETGSLISEEKYNEFVQKLCKSTHKLSDDQLRETLLALTQLPPEESVRAPNFMELWNNLDIECCRRIEKWKTDELLLLCDAWYTLKMARICEFVWQAMRKLGRRVYKMEPQQLVQTMFICNILRKSVFDMFEFEANLTKCAKEMSIAELGVMSMGFFKTQTLIRNPELIDYLYERLMAELMTVDDITFVAILKVLRYSSNLKQADAIANLLDKICKEKFDSMNLLTNLHVALLGSGLQMCHDDLMVKIINKFYNEIDQARIKDIERICFAMSLFNIRTESKIEDKLNEKILNSLHDRIDEIIKFPKCFTNLLHYLSLNGYYDPEMLSSALDKKFLKHAVGSRLPLCREIFHLDTFVKLNLKHLPYEGNQLEQRHRQTMGKMLTHYVPEANSRFNLTKTDKMLLQFKETTDVILPHNAFIHILPNYERADIVICYDRLKRKSIPIAESCPPLYTGAILTRDLLLGGDPYNQQHVDTVAIVIGGWNNVVRNKNRNTGLLDMKIQQLQMLGHKTLLIYWYEWRELETHLDRVHYVKRRLSAILNL